MQCYSGILVISSHMIQEEASPPLLVAPQELALTGRTPALPPPHQGGIGADWPASVQTLGRLLAICLAQQAAQCASHVVPLLPHAWQKTFTFMHQLLSFMSAHV